MLARRGWKPIKIVDCLFFCYGIFVIDLINENQGNGRVCKFKIKPRKVHRGHIKGSKSDDVMKDLRLIRNLSNCEREA